MSKKKPDATLDEMNEAAKRGGTAGLSKYVETHDVAKVWDRLEKVKALNRKLTPDQRRELKMPPTTAERKAAKRKRKIKMAKKSRKANR